MDPAVRDLDLGVGVTNHLPQSSLDLKHIDLLQVRTLLYSGKDRYMLADCGSNSVLVGLHVL